jgi:hypothetical protein
MNLVGTWWGAVPSCHGAGGLAAQTRFGATSGCAPVLLGFLKLFLGLLFGSSMYGVLAKFPDAVLGESDHISMKQPFDVRSFIG